MNLASVKVGDIVEVDKRGRRFYAEVRETGPELALRPHDRRVNYYTATAREVVGVYHANTDTRRKRGLA